MGLTKIETREWYNSDLDKLHKEGRDIYVKLKIGKRLTHGEYEREPNNGFLVINNEDTFPLTLDNYEVYTETTTELTEKQLIVLVWLIHYLERTKLTIADSLHNLISGKANDATLQVWADLSSVEEAEVIRELVDYVIDKGGSL